VVASIYYICIVAFVTAVLGISIFLLLTFILSLLSRINLLERQIAGIENMISKSESELHEVGDLIKKSTTAAAQKE
jgi:hypothetical protein